MALAVLFSCTRSLDRGTFIEFEGSNRKVFFLCSSSITGISGNSLDGSGHKPYLLKGSTIKFSDVTVGKNTTIYE
jgi:hypothetical protein